jgi:hypothetical protein
MDKNMNNVKITKSPLYHLTGEQSYEFSNPVTQIVAQTKTVEQAFIKINANMTTKRRNENTKAK